MNDHTVELRAAWLAHVADDSTLLDRLLARHRERHRRYHTADHVAWTLRHVGELAADEPVDDLGAVVAAVFYHDAVYEPASPANERASARLAQRDLAELGWPSDRVDRVRALIEATGLHLAPDGEPAEHELGPDTAVLLDADLAVLGAEPAAYREYAVGVRAEYAHLDDHEWRAGRRSVLNALVDRDPLYRTAGARRRWEHRARANIAAELAALDDAGG